MPSLASLSAPPIREQRLRVPRDALETACELYCCWWKRCSSSVIAGVPVAVAVVVPVGIPVVGAIVGVAVGIVVRAATGVV